MDLGLEAFWSSFHLVHINPFCGNLSDLSGGGGVLILVILGNRL